MSLAHSKLLTAPPAFLSMVSMVREDREEIVRELVHAERKSPAIYDPTRALFFRVLQNDLSFDRALAQARKLQDAVERRCAIAVLEASESFLRTEQPAKLSKLPAMTIALPNEMNVLVSPVWTRHLDPDRLFVLHVWHKPLSDLQLSGFAGILRAALTRQQPRYAFCDIDFVSVAEPEHASGRRLRKYGWERLRPLDEDALLRFLVCFCDAWEEYQRRGPREVKLRRQPDLFG